MVAALDHWGLKSNIFVVAKLSVILLGRCLAVMAKESGFRLQ